jgi:hypothetical protein
MPLQSSAFIDIQREIMNAALDGLDRRCKEPVILQPAQVIGRAIRVN